MSSVRPTTLLAGKVLGVGAVGLTQMAIWLFATLLMFRYRVPMMNMFGLEATPLPMPNVSITQLALLLVFFLLGYTLYSKRYAGEAYLAPADSAALSAWLGSAAGD